MRENASLFALIRSSMPEDRARPFIETEGDLHYTWGDLDSISARFGNYLRAQGVTKGDRVAVQVQKSPEAVFLYLACLRAGAVFLPLNTAYTLAELDYFFGDAEPRVSWSAILLAPPSSPPCRARMAGRC